MSGMFVLAQLVVQNAFTHGRRRGSDQVLQGKPARLEACGEPATALWVAGFD
jgi:hypothetical protein